MRIYDVVCDSCEFEDEQFLDDNEEFYPCPRCKGTVRRIFTKMTFKLFNDPKSQMVGWGHNNYNHNRYWDDYKAAKEQGRDVRPFNDDPA